MLQVQKLLGLMAAAVIPLDLLNMSHSPKVMCSTIVEEARISQQRSGFGGVLLLQCSHDRHFSQGMGCSS